MIRSRSGSRGTTPSPGRRPTTPATDTGRVGRLRGALGRSMGRRRILLVLVPLTLVVLVAALPTQKWLDNRRAIAAAESQLSGLRAANERAAATAESLRSGAELERLAREQYGYAKPGEEVYHVLPAPRDPVRVPDAWPFSALGAALGR